MTNTQFPQSKWVHILMCNTHREGEKKGEKKEQRAALMPQLNRILFFFFLSSLTSVTRNATSLTSSICAALCRQNPNACAHIYICLLCSFPVSNVSHGVCVCVCGS